MQYYFSLIKKFSKSRWISRMSDDRELITEIDSFGRKTWKNKNGLLHRLDGPAVEWNDGTKEWWQNGSLHRLDGPAYENINGAKQWYQNGLLHRLDGPALEFYNGDKHWYQNDLLHRLDGPAIDRADGEKLWYKNGKMHRIDGPAAEWVDGKNITKGWCKDGRTFKNKDAFFSSLSKKEKEAALFSEDFLNA